MTRYLLHADGVEMIGVSGDPIVLLPHQVDQLLDIYSEQSAVGEFLALYDIAKQHPLFIPRTSSFRGPPGTSLRSVPSQERDNIIYLERSAR